MFPVAHHIDSTDGVRLAVYDLGGDGPDVILSHATGFCAQAWAPLADALIGTHRWALDFRAHGRSTRPNDGNLSWDGVGDDVLALVDRVGLTRPFGVGHSMGGAALMLAELARPGLLSGIWAFEPIVIPPDVFPHEPGTDDLLSNSLSVSAARRRTTFDSLDAARANFSSKPPMRSFDARALEGYLLGGFEELPDGSVTLRCRSEDEAQFYVMGGRHTAYDGLPRIDVPTWVIQGAEAGPGPAMFAPRIAERIPAAILVEHHELSHFGPFEAPDALAAEISDAVVAVRH